MHIGTLAVSAWACPQSEITVTIRSLEDIQVSSNTCQPNIARAQKEIMLAISVFQH